LIHKSAFLPELQQEDRNAFNQNTPWYPPAIWIQSALGYEAFRAQVSMPGYSAPAATFL